MDRQFFIIDNLNKFEYRFNSLEAALLEINRIYPLDEPEIYKENKYVSIVEEVVEREGIRSNPVYLRVVKNSSKGLYWRETKMEELPSIHVLKILEKPINGFLFEVKSYPVFPKEDTEIRFTFFNNEICDFIKIPVERISAEDFPIRFSGAYFFFDSTKLDFILRIAWEEEFDDLTKNLDFIKEYVLRLESKEMTVLNFLDIYDSMFRDYKDPAYNPAINSLVFSIKVMDSVTSLITETSMGILKEKDSSQGIFYLETILGRGASSKAYRICNQSLVENGFVVHSDNRISHFSSAIVQRNIKMIFNRKSLIHSKSIKSFELKVLNVLISVLQSFFYERSILLESMSKKPSLSYVKF